MSCRKFLLSSRTKQLICMNLSRCVDIRIRHWKTWTINSKISEKILLMKLNVKKSLSSLTQIRIMIDQFLALDLKSLNSNLNRVLVRLLNHHSKIKWISSIVIIVKNLNISFATVVHSKRWISIASYARWTYIKRTIRQLRISRSSREKSNLCYSRCRDRWDENNEDRCLQFRRHSFRR
jgi:hypothetical protein